MERALEWVSGGLGSSPSLGLCSDLYPKGAIFTQGFSNYVLGIPRGSIGGKREEWGEGDLGDWISTNNVLEPT